MKIIRCHTDQGDHYGVVEENSIRLLAGPPFDGIAFSGEKLALAEARLLAPCVPGKIVAVGLNYARHAEELAAEVPTEPLLFLKPSTAVIGPEEAIILPAMSRQVEYEGELAVVVGRRVKNVPEAEALDAVFGYTCINDVTARDLQKKDVQFTRSKSFDTFAPVGPWIETDVKPAGLALETRVNGKVRQTASTDMMIWSVPALVSFISRIMTLLPGDIIATGTPVGVGPLAAGDTVSVTIEKIGTLSNTVAVHQ